jgi:type II secretion system protein H
MDRVARTAGFSLVEMLVVLAILALSTAVLAPGLSGRQTQLSPSDKARELGRLLVSTRNAVLADGRPRSVYIAFGQMRASTKEPPRPEVSLAGFTLRASVAGELLDQRGELEIPFQADGSSTGVEIEMRAAGGASSRVSLHWLTGRVHVTEEIAQ